MPPSPSVCVLSFVATLAGCGGGLPGSPLRIAQRAAPAGADVSPVPISWPGAHFFVVTRGRERVGMMVGADGEALGGTDALRALAVGPDDDPVLLAQVANLLVDPERDARGRGVWTGDTPPEPLAAAPAIVDGQLVYWRPHSRMKHFMRCTLPLAPLGEVRCVSSTDLARAAAAPPTQEAAVADPLEPWLALRDLPRQPLLQRVDVAPAAVEHGRAYGPTTGLDLVHVSAPGPARVYLRGDDVLMVHVDETALASLDPAALAARFPPDLTLPSRAGKTFEHHVAARAGVAWSEDGERVVILELFQPTDVAGFRATLYAEPGPFRK